MVKRKNLLFTSAGDNTQFYKLWCQPERTYDIFVCYYGDKKYKPYQKYCDYYAERKGGKFQNFEYFWKENKEVESNVENSLNIRDYDNYFIIDDDILIFTKEINQLFDYLEEYQLYILQPSFKPLLSKISHPITQSIPNMILHYTNFIEVNAPLFSKEALTQCMSVYDNSLTGYGIDFLFLWKLGTEHKNKYAVIDCISCVNPHNRKGTVREIVKLEPNYVRVSKWEAVKRKYHIVIPNHTIYGFVPKK